LHVTLTRNGTAAKPSMAFAALRLAGERQGFPREPKAFLPALHVTLTRNGTAAKPSMAFAALRLAGERQGFPREPAACCIHAKHGHPARFRLARHGQRQGLPGRAAAAILAAG
jgi:hypothetical protein